MVRRQTINILPLRRNEEETPELTYSVLSVGNVPENENTLFRGKLHSVGIAIDKTFWCSKVGNDTFAVDVTFTREKVQ